MEVNMSKICSIVFITVSILGLTASVHASPESQALIVEGRAFLFNNSIFTYSGIVAANEKFEAAVATDPTDEEANFFYAITRICAFILEQGSGGGLETLGDVFEAFGVTRSDNDYVEQGPPFNDPPETDGHYNPPAVIPSGEEVRAFLAGPFVTLLEGSLSNVSVITDPFLVTLRASETGELHDVEVDYCDVLLLKSALYGLRCYLLIASAYDLDIDLRDIVVLGNAGVLQIQRDLLDKYGNLLTLRGDGTTSLDSAKQSLLDAIAAYRDALTCMENEPDDQADDLFYFGSSEDESMARVFLTHLTEAESSVNENRPASFTAIKDTWILTDGNGDRLQMEIEKDTNGNFAGGSVQGLDGCGFICCGGSVEYFSVSATNVVTITVSCGGWCPVSATLSGTINTDQITGGTFDATDCQQTWSGEFTGILQNTETKTETIDFNCVFGNTGKTPLDIRAVLPEFDQYDDIIPNTFPPTDDSSPVLNGLFPDYPTNADLTKLLDLQPSGTFNIPTVTISIDGDFTDWDSITPVFTDLEADEKVDFQGMDLKDFYMAQDNDNYYFRMTFYDGLGSSSGGASPTYHFKACSSPEGNPAGDRFCGVDPENLNVWVLETSGAPGYPIDLGISYPGFAATGTGTIEWKVPRDDMGIVSGEFVNVWTHMVAQPQIYNVSDYNHTRIILDPTSVSGTVTCYAHNGAGNIFVYALDGPDPNTAHTLGSIYISGPGPYSINGLPVGAEVYLFAHWDADENGIKTFGDLIVRSGPHTVEDGGTTVNLSLDEQYHDIDYVVIWGGNSTGGPIRFAGCAVQGIAPWDMETLTLYGPGGLVGDFDIEGSITTHYLFGTLYSISAGGSLPDQGWYDFVLKDKDGLEYWESKYFTPNLIDVVDMSTGISPLDSAYVNTTTPTFSWSPVTDETVATLYYRINIRDWNRKVVVYTSERSPDTTVTVPDGFLEPDTAYTWQVQVYDSQNVYDVNNLSSSEWRGFATGAPDEPLAIEWAFVNSRVWAVQDQTPFVIEIKGPSPWDVRSMAVSGPGGFSYTFSSADLWQEGFYHHSEEGILMNGTYTFSVVDDRDGSTVFVDKEFNFNELPIPEYLFSPQHNAYIQTTTPTFSWSPVTDETTDPVYYRISIFDYKGNSIYKSERSTSTTATVPAGILKVNNPYKWRVDPFDDDSEPQNMASSLAQSFYILRDNPPTSMTGQIDPGSSGYISGGKIYVTVCDAPWPNGKMLAYTVLTDPGSYTLYNLPVDTELYIYIFWDKDMTGIRTPGDWIGEYGSNPMILSAGDNPTGVDMVLASEIQATSLSGEITCGNFQPGQGEIYVGVFDGADPDSDGWLGGTSISAPGAYSVSNLPVGSLSWVFAYWDANGSGAGGSDVGDYSGSFVDNPVLLSTEGPSSINLDLAHEIRPEPGSISGRVVDEATGEPVDDASTGSIYLDEGWHKFVYRHEEVWGGQASRAAFKAPGDIDWRLFSTSELQIRTSPEASAQQGIVLTTKRNVWDRHPENRGEMAQCVNVDGIEEPGWYGESVVSFVYQNQNIHGNDDNYTSYYEAYFYVDTAGLWWFSTDSDDASGILIDDRLIAYWYSGHGYADRWEHKFDINLLLYDTGEWVESTRGNPDGTFRFTNLPSGNYIVQATAPGYFGEFFEETPDWDQATAVTLTGSEGAVGVDFTLEKQIDTDGDGMSDDWEQLIIDVDSEDDIVDMYDVLPQDDYDGDGFSNLREFLSASSGVDAQVIPGCWADVFLEGDVDGEDLAIFAEEYFYSVCPCTLDMDGDGDIDAWDFTFFCEDYGRTDCQ
jgi:hypothetical protein